MAKYLHALVSPLRRKVASWWAMPRQEKLWLVPAWILLGIVRCVLLIVPFRRIAPLLGKSIQETSLEPRADESQIAYALSIGHAIELAASYAPWESKCLAQAITARVLLGLNSLPYSLFLGVHNDTAQGMRAHAWVRTGCAIVTGENGCLEFTVVSTFVSPNPSRSHFS